MIEAAEFTHFLSQFNYHLDYFESLSHTALNTDNLLSTSVRGTNEYERLLVYVNDINFVSKKYYLAFKNSDQDY